MEQFRGTGVALITPFKKEQNHIVVDHEALARMVNHQIHNGVDYLVVLGTTAETATLSYQEKNEVIDTIVAANNKRLPLVLGVGGNNTQEVVAQIKQVDATKFAAILSVSPYYNKPTQEGIFQHFKCISETSLLPIILYNVPGRTASNMHPDTVARLANSCSNIIGIKEAAGDMIQAMQLIAKCPKEFLVISGDDMLTLPMVLAGGAGVISVIGEAFPQQFSKMVQLGLQGKTAEAYTMHYAIAPAIDLSFEEGNPAGIKALCNSLNLCEPIVRLPLVSASQKLQKALAVFAASFN